MRQPSAQSMAMASSRNRNPYPAVDARQPQIIPRAERGLLSARCIDALVEKRTHLRGADAGPCSRRPGVETPDITLPSSPQRRQAVIVIPDSPHPSHGSAYCSLFERSRLVVDLASNWSRIIDNTFVPHLYNAARPFVISWRPPPPAHSGRLDRHDDSYVHAHPDPCSSAHEKQRRAWAGSK
jgi:hypothetical protein